MGKKVNFGKAIVDVSGIVFAVLLALWLENWMQEKEKNDLAQEISSRITIEIQENRTELVSAIDENQTVIVAINSYLSADEKDLQQLSDTQFFATNSSDAAWVSAKMTNSITLMPLDQIRALADLYETQKYHTNYNQNFFRGIAELMVVIQYEEDKTRALSTYMMNISISNSIGQQLLAKYDSYLGIEDDQTS